GRRARVWLGRRRWNVGHGTVLEADDHPGRGELQRLHSPVACVRVVQRPRLTRPSGVARRRQQPAERSTTFYRGILRRLDCGFRGNVLLRRSPGPSHDPVALYEDGSRDEPHTRLTSAQPRLLTARPSLTTP